MLSQIKHSITVIAVGDMMFDTRVRPPRVFYHVPATATCISGFRSAAPIPFINDEASRSWIEKQGVSMGDINKTSHLAQSLLLDLPGDAADPKFPFRKIRSELARADVVFGNLECPLSERGRSVRGDCCYVASPEYAHAMAASNFKVISYSNNHCMDFGEVAFSDTIEALQHSGIQVVGAGRNYESARKPALLEINGARLAFLAYNLFGPDIVYATANESGVVPLNDLVVREDVERLVGNVDYIFASVHWGVEGEPRPSPSLVRFAHRLIDYGVDVIFGHHPHLPGSIEIYKSKPIFYSLGNFIFGHTHHYWTDNMMVRLTLSQNQVCKVEIIPIGNRGLEQYQPVVLYGERAAGVIRFVSHVSSQFGTTVTIEESKGRILPGSAKAAEIA